MCSVSPTGTGSPAGESDVRSGSAVIGSFVQLHIRQTAQSRYIGLFIMLGFRLQFADAADKGRILFLSGVYSVVGGVLAWY